MKRREFLKITTPLAAAPLFLNAIPVKTFATKKMVASLDCIDTNDRVLVVIFLGGANDGVNTIIPIEQYDYYANVRPSLRISDSGTKAYHTLDSSLTGMDAVGLHPTLTAMKAMYEKGMLNIVQGVGYPSINRSHFRSTDLWLKGSDGIMEHADGWIGRYFESRYPDAVNGPTSAQPDPLGIQLGGSTLSLGFHTQEQDAVALTLAGQDPSGFFTYFSEVGGLPPDTFPDSDYGRQLEFLVGQQKNTGKFAARISEVFNGGQNLVAYPDYKLADQLKTVARLISGGSRTKVYYATMGGFDTHAAQVEPDNPTIGRHASLLAELSDSVKAFYDDLKALQADQRVVTAAFSEFARKVVQNGNFGTDHGTLGPMFIFGSSVRAGVTGTNVNLSNQDEGGALHIQGMQHDYRTVFGSLMVDWLGAGNSILHAIGFESFISGNQKLSLVDAEQVADPQCDELAKIGEVGKVSVNQPDRDTWHTVNLMNSYNNPVVIISPVSFENPSAVTVRVKNVQADSFMFQLSEWMYMDGTYPQETISYLVVEAGTYYLNNHIKLMAGNTECDHNWKKVKFPESFTDQPVVFTQCVSFLGKDTVITRKKDINQHSFRLQLREEEAKNNYHYFETVSWIAVERGEYDTGMAFEIGKTQAAVTDENYLLSFNQSYSPNPVFLADIQTHNGSDPCTIRYDALNSEEVNIFIQEEQSYDQEASHGSAEEVGYITFQAAGVLHGTPGDVFAQSASNLLSGHQVSIAIYPNPFLESFKLTIRNAQMKTAAVEITDFKGQPVFTDRAYPTGVDKAVDASFFDIGIFIVDVTVDGEHKTIRVVKKE